MEARAEPSIYFLQNTREANPTIDTYVLFILGSHAYYMSDDVVNTLYKE